jgi:antitoxin FitA
MASVTIRNLDETTVRALKQRAKVNHRSLEAELREILQSAVRTRNKAELMAIADRIRAMTPNIPQTDSTELLREDRDR